MKKYLTNTLAGILISTASNIYAQNRQIEFEKDTIWENTLEKAKKEDKLIFLDAYTDWCIPCKKMEKEVFTNDSVADFYNGNFINLRINTEKSITEKKLANKYEINSYPTLLYINDKEEIIYKAVGGKNTKEFIEIGKKALNLEKEIIDYREKPKYNSKIVHEQIQKLNQTEINYSKTLEDYFKTQNEKEILSKINWEIISLDKSEEKIESKHFEFLLENKEKFDSLYNNVDSVIKSSYMNSLKKIINSKNDSLKFESWKSKVRSSNLDNSKEILIEGQMSYNWKNTNWEKYVQNALSLDSLNAEHKKTSNRINNAATRLFYESKGNDKEILEKVLEWTKLSMELNENWGNLNLRALALYESGKRKKAIKMEEKAIEGFKKTPSEGLQFILKDLENKLEKMKKGEEIK